MVFKNQHAHTKKAIAGAGGALGGRPVTWISMCTYSTPVWTTNPTLISHQNQIAPYMDFVCMQLWNWDILYTHCTPYILEPFFYPNYPTILEKNLFNKLEVKIEKINVQEVLGPKCYVGRVRLRACGVYHLLATNILVCAQDGGVLLIICMVVEWSNGYLTQCIQGLGPTTPEEV